MTETTARNPYAALGKILNAEDRRKQKVRQLMSRRVPPNEKPFVWSVGYNNCSSRYTTRPTATISGSSLNRSLKPAKKNVRTKNPHHGKDLQSEAYPLGKYYTHAVVRETGPKDSRWPEISRALYCSADLQTIESLLTHQEVGRVKAHRDAATLIGRSLPISFRVYELCPRSRAKIRDKITAFFRASGGARTFVTLTFVAAITDDDAIGLLNSFLTQIRKQFAGLQYLWVAERQENGNIHFHMLVNRRLPVGRFNATWVLCQYNAGLRGKTDKGDEITFDQILEAYRLDERVKFAATVVNEKSGKKRTHVQSLLNPFDVKKVSSISGLACYVTKYVTKQAQGTRFGCRTWHCSRGVSRMFTRQLTTPSTFRYLNSFANYWVDKETGEMHRPQVLKGAFWCTVYVCRKKAPLPYLKKMEQVNRWILDGWLPDALTWLDRNDQFELYQQNN